jgi:mannose-6-phosphate isomerase
MPESCKGGLYPLRLTPLLKEKVWGGPRLRRMFGPEEPAERRIGEVWTAWDKLPIENGPLAGARISDLVRAQPLAVLGSRLAQARPCAFPLLAKFIDASEMLSVQVHPDDDYAHRCEAAPYGKAEAWYVLEVDPGARLIHGVRKKLSRAEAEQAVTAGNLQDQLESIEVEPGDVIWNPPGSIHALGPGILLFELQQSSDLTYRLYDWDRRDPGRPLHVGKALDVAHLEPNLTHKIPSLAIQEPGGERAFLCTDRRIAAERWRVRTRMVQRPQGRCFHLLTILEGMGTLEVDHPETSLSMRPGQSVLVPAEIDEYALRAEGGPLVVINGYVPDLAVDVAGPLRAAGFSDAQIGRLSGESRSADGPGDPQDGQ